MYGNGQILGKTKPVDNATSCVLNELFVIKPKGDPRSIQWVAVFRFKNSRWKVNTNQWFDWIKFENSCTITFIVKRASNIRLIENFTLRFKFDLMDKDDIGDDDEVGSVSFLTASVWI